MKKNTLQFVGLVILVCAILVGAAYVTSFTGSKTALGSQIDGQAYNSTTTDSTWSATNGAFRVLKVGPGMFGSVIVTTNTAGVVNIYDGTTTTGTAGGYYATTTLAKIGTSATTNTYTFDVSFTKGLLIELQGTNLASTTITYK